MIVEIQMAYISMTNFTSKTGLNQSFFGALTKKDRL
jgi:hypothetical protein